jgi:hypothetical protein
MIQFADVLLWWGGHATVPRNQYGPLRGCNLLCNANGAIDEDAPKKATTDALTKLLSHLGFSADVFLGLYDDNKYVARLQQQFGARRKAMEETIPPSIKALIEDMRKITTSEADLLAHYHKNAALIKQQTQAQQDFIRLQYSQHKATLLAQDDEDAA